MKKQQLIRMCALALLCHVGLTGGAATVPDYVQDGLIAQWDGIDNAATGTHVATTNRWTDLVAGREFVFAKSKFNFSADRLNVPLWQYDYAELSAEDTDETFELAGRGHGTVELFVLNTRNATSVALQAPGGVVFKSYNGSSNLAGGLTSRFLLQWGWDCVATNTFSVCYDNTVRGDAYVNGVLKTYSPWSSQMGCVAESGDKTVIGCNQAHSTDWFGGSIYQIRVYNRRLWPEERLQNYYVDRARFQGVVHIPDDGGYAYHTGSKLVSPLTDTSFYTVTENAGGTDVGTYPVKLALVDKTNLTWDDGTTDDKTLQFTIRTPVVLSPSSDDWLTIQTAIDNAAIEDVITLSAGTYTPTNTFTMKKPVTLCGADRSTVVLDFGKKCSGFSLSDDRAFVRNLTITNCSASGSVGGGVTMSRGMVSNCFIVACGAASGGGVRLTGGEVRDCTFRSCSAGTTSGPKGGGVYMEGGTVSNCTFQSCITGYNNSSECGGSGAYVKGGLLTHCRVLDSTDDSWCGSIYSLIAEAGTVRNTLICGIVDDTTTSKATRMIPLYLKGGTVEYCTVAGTDSGSAANPAVTMTSGTLVNTVIWGNNASQQLKTSGGTVSYCCYPEATDGENGNTSSDPVFVDAANRDFHLKDRSSSAVFTATPLAGVTDDLEGLARNATKPSMGAFEYDISKEPFAVYAKVGQANYPEGATVHAWAEVAGTTATPTYSWKINDVAIAATTEEIDLNLAPGRYTLAVTATADGKTETGSTTVTVKPLTVYVDKNGSGDFPYAAEGSAAPSVTKALEALWFSSTTTGKIVVAEGEYSIDDGMLYETPIVIEGKGRDKSVIYGTTKTIATCRLCTDGSAVRDVTISNMYQGVYMTRGTVENARFVNCGGPQYGGGVQMSGGTVRNCEFVGCYSSGDGWSSKGGGVYISGGMVSNCLFQGCRTYNHATGGCGAYVYGGMFENNRIFDSSDGGYSDNIIALYVEKGTVRNILISGIHDDTTVCSATTITPLYVMGGTVEYCTVAGCDPGSAKSPAVSVTGGTLVNSISWGNNATEQLKTTGGSVTYCCYAEATDGENGNTSADPQFVDAANRDFHLKNRSSSAVFAGTPLADALYDIEGLERNGDKPSMGVYEYDISKETFDVIAKADQENYPMGSNVTVRCIVTGTLETPTYVWKVNGETISQTSEEVTLELGPGRHAVSVTATAGGKTDTGTTTVTVRPTTVYVDWDGTATFPYATKGSAATNVTQALEGLWLSSSTTGRIVVGTGTYRVDEAILTELPIVIEGAGMDESVICSTQRNFTTCRLCTGGSAVRNVTISNMYQGVYMTRGTVENARLVNCGGPAYGGGVQMTGGTVRNCEFVGCYSNGNGWSSKGGGVYMEGGTVTNCTFRNCRTCNHATGGCGAYMKGGTFANCRILDSADSGYSDTLLSSLYVENGTVRNVLVSGITHDWTYCKSVTITPLYIANGTVENVTVTGCDPEATMGPAVTLVKGTLRNTIIWGNVATAQLSQTGGTVEYCCYAEATEGVNGNTACDPKLRMRPNGRITLRLSSPVIDAGENLSWMVEGATDVYGNPRVKRGKVDMGCSEWQPAGLLLIVK